MEILSNTASTLWVLSAFLYIITHAVNAAIEDEHDKAFIILAGIFFLCLFLALCSTFILLILHIWS